MNMKNYEFKNKKIKDNITDVVNFVVGDVRMYADLEHIKKYIN